MKVEWCPDHDEYLLDVTTFKVCDVRQVDWGKYKHSFRNVSKTGKTGVVITNDPRLIKIYMWDTSSYEIIPSRTDKDRALFFVPYSKGIIVENEICLTVKSTDEGYEAYAMCMDSIALFKEELIDEVEFVHYSPNEHSDPTEYRIKVRINRRKDHNITRLLDNILFTLGEYLFPWDWGSNNLYREFLRGTNFTIYGDRVYKSLRSGRIESWSTLENRFDFVDTVIWLDEWEIIVKLGNKYYRRKLYDNSVEEENIDLWKVMELYNGYNLETVKSITI